MGAKSFVALFREGQAICSQGDASKEVFYIEKGQLKVTVKSNRGKETVLGILHRGDYFGAGCMRDQAIRTATATGNYTMSDPGHRKEGDDTSAPQWP